MAKCVEPILANDYGEVRIDAEARCAIEMVQDMAASMQMTAAEFISIFDYGFPECPHCKADQEVH